MQEIGWCSAELVLATKCQRCHRDPPENGAPFPLLHYADTQVIDSKGKPRFERMAEAVSSDYMPARFLKLDPPVEALTNEEKHTLLEWLGRGAPLSGTAVCDQRP